MTANLATIAACIAALIPQGTLRELARLRAATEVRTGVSALELQARRKDLQSRLAEIQARGDVDMSQLWRLIGKEGLELSPSFTAVPGATGRDISEHSSVAVDGKNLRSVMREQAERTGNHALVTAVDRGFSESYEFIRVPENTEHDVPEPFELQITPLTQGQIMVYRFYKSELTDAYLPLHRGKKFAEGDHLDLGDGITVNYDHPAENVSAIDADMYVAWLNALPAVITSGCRYDLLTSAQYTHALYWSLNLPYFLTIEMFTSDKKMLEVGFARENSRYSSKIEGTHAVSKLAAHPRGLRHMVGNVWTTTKDHSGNDRVIWGGSYLNAGGHLRVPFRVDFEAAVRSPDVGMRLVRICP